MSQYEDVGRDTLSKFHLNDARGHYINATLACDQRDIRRSIVSVATERGLIKQGEVKA